MITDWGRIARVQEDGYDTTASATLGLARYGWTKQPPQPGDVTWLDGTVRLIEPTTNQTPRSGPVSPTHPHLALADEILRLGWPAMYAQCQALLQGVHTYLTTDSTVDPTTYGCSCGPATNRVSMEVTVTVNGPLGILEGVVHELAHNKMKYHGISLYHWERLLANPFATEAEIASGTGPNVFVSPIRKDKLRPMGACISAHYSYLHVAELLLQVLERDTLTTVLGPVTDNWSGVRSWLDLQGQRVTEGRDLITAHVQTDADGVPYFAALQAWAADLLTRIAQQRP